MPERDIEIANLYNEYNLLLDELFKDLKNTSFSVFQNFNSLKSTDADQIQIKLLNNSRMNTINVKTKETGLFELQIYEPIKPETDKNSQESLINEVQITNEEEKSMINDKQEHDETTADVDSKNQENEIIPINPITLIHSNARSFKSTQIQTINNLQTIMKILNLKTKLNNLLD